MEKYTATLMADEAGETFSIVGTRKIGPFYRTASSAIGMKIDREKAIKVIGQFSSDYGGVVFIYRTGPEVVRVEVEMQDGEKHTITEWTNDFAGFPVNDKEEWHPGTYRAFNADGELLGEVYY